MIPASMRHFTSPVAAMAVRSTVPLPPPPAVVGGT
ncbi:CRISPR-associated protein Cas5 [Methylobacterium sp. R2-1]